MKFTRSLSSSSFCRSQNDSFESNNNEKNAGSEDEMDYNSSKYKKIGILTDLNSRKK